VPDSITVQYDAQTGGEMTCAGTSVASGLVTAAFEVNNVTDPPAMTCNGTVVVDNIEDMQITYGIDSNKDGVIESYKAAPSAVEFGQTAAVNVALTVRGPTANAATGGDGFLRQTYTSTFTVRNQAR